MNPRTVIAAELEDWLDQEPMLECAGAVLEALRAAANGGPVVLRWDTTPCPDCAGDGWGGGTRDRKQHECPSCDGSGVVEAVTMWGLERVGPIDEATWVSRTHLDEPLYGLAALNTEGPT